MGASGIRDGKEQIEQNDVESQKKKEDAEASVQPTLAPLQEAARHRALNAMSEHLAQIRTPWTGLLGADRVREYEAEIDRILSGAVIPIKRIEAAHFSKEELPLSFCGAVSNKAIKDAPEVASFALSAEELICSYYNKLCEQISDQLRFSFASKVYSAHNNGVRLNISPETVQGTWREFLESESADRITYRTLWGLIERFEFLEKNIIPPALWRSHSPDIKFASLYRYAPWKDPVIRALQKEHRFCALFCDSWPEKVIYPDTVDAIRISEANILSLAWLTPLPYYEKSFGNLHGAHLNMQTPGLYWDGIKAVYLVPAHLCNP